MLPCIFVVIILLVLNELIFFGYNQLIIFYTISRSTRHLNHISISQFLTDLNMLPTHDAQSLNNSLILTLDINAPVFNKTTILRPNTSWYTIDLYSQKRCLRMLESKWKKEKSSSSLTTYKDLKNV